MSGDNHHLPALVSSQSLTSELEGLDRLATRLSSLSLKAESKSMLPNSRSSEGRMASENIRINIGGEWWVDMTPDEGQAWIRRRKTALLEEHTKILDKLRSELEPVKPAESSQPTVPITKSEPTPRSPTEPEDQAKAGSSDARPKEPETISAITPETASAPFAKITTNEASKEKGKPPVQQIVNEAEPKGILKGKGKSKEVIPEISSTGGKSMSKAQNSETKTLASALEQFMASQNALAQATGSNVMPTGNPGEVMINEEGLPIHEIREDENGKLLNEVPVGKAEVEIKVDEEKDDFWSKEAVARREALRRKVFDDPSDSDDESDLETPVDDTRASSSITTTPPTPSTKSDPTLDTTRRTSASSSSASAIQPKSILKSSAPRKKSVSFDSSVPVPPDSPGQSTTRIGGSMFPNPVINIETGIEERAVPVLNAPKRSPNRATFDEPFAGFKSGFLGGGSKGKVSSPSPVNFSDEPSPMTKAIEPITISADGPVPSSQTKKKSLFAQGQSDPTPSTEIRPTFPAMSTSTHTSSVKNEIIERPSLTPPTSQAGPSRIPMKDRITGKTAGVASTVTERSEPIAGPSRLTSHLPQTDEGYDDEDEDDDDSFYADDDDDDEYDLDDALLAREVALAYHQNRAYSLLGQQNARSQRSSEENPEGYDESYVDGYGSDEGEEGGVMLGIPQISMMNEDGMPSIVNPTPDDLRRFVRVGKLDNGKLVLAPGEDGWSDEDEGRDVKQEKNREEIKAALLGKGGPAVPKAQEKRTGDEAIGMPPVIEKAGATPVQGIVKEKNTSPAVQSELADPPKKVSRFKAARMG